MPTRPLAIALAGLVSLAVAMGIGRFAFTPLLPLLLAEGATDIAGASVLASLNYLGYLLGALACTWQPWLWRRLGWNPAPNLPWLARAGLVATVLLTLAMALDAPWAWTWLRLAAGIASAVVFVYTSGWCLEQLARRSVPEMGAVIYAGPGIGILVTGLAAMGLVGAGSSAATGWLAFGALGALLVAAIWRVFDRAGRPAAAAATGPHAGAPAPYHAGLPELLLFCLAYGTAGFGYIITATFLPVIARAALPGSPWLDLFWPLFGLGVMLGALGASRIRRAGDQRLRLATGFAVQATAVALGVLSPTPAGFALGSFFLGLPFTAITYFAMQEARRLRPQQATSLIGLLTAVYGVGQIAGPPIAAALVARSATPAAGFAQSLWIASGTLLLGMILSLLLARRYPLRG